MAERDCQHGRLARKCEICELIAAEAEIERLEGVIHKTVKVTDSPLCVTVIFEALVEEWRKIDAKFKEAAKREITL